jgi:cysteinyl-tRNA synthetase
MTLRLYDTFTRSLREFRPLRPPLVRMYACGPTVYEYAHIGNLRSYLFEDVLRRVLEFNGYQVRHVVNITDVGHLTSDADEGEDRMERGAQRTGKSAWEIAELYAQAFKEDLSHLNVLEPTIWCRATEHIPEQIALVECIEAKGFTYRTADGIYFDTSRLANYGHLARLDVNGLQAGARVDVGEKRNATDFALWKFSPAGQKRQMEWDSPWGTGFPGWHIECSAMSAKYLGVPFDIHCGGEDHIPIHHTNEIAQTQACYGKTLANFWLHGTFLVLDETKMSKSLGGTIRLQTLMEQGFDPLVYRYFCLNAHYRSKLSFTWEGLDGPATALDRLRAASYEWGKAGTPDPTYLERFAGQVTWELVKSNLDEATKKATLLVFDRVLGLGLAEWEPPRDEVPDGISALVVQRQQARAEKRWAEADSLRAQIWAAGYDVEDTPEGPRVRRRNRQPGQET